MAYSSYKKKGKKSKKKTYKKKYGRTSKRAGKRKSTKYSASAVFPETTTKSFTYFQTVYLDPEDPAPLVALHAFRTNSIHDPNFTSIGIQHQPRGHDEWACLYNNYDVLSSVISASYQPVQPRMLGALTTNKSALTITYVDTIDMRESMNTKCRLLTNVNTSGKATTLTSRWSKKDYPQDIPLHNRTGIMGNTGIGSNPVFEPRFDVFLAITDGSGVAANTPVDIKIIYTVKLFNRKKIAQS